MTEKEYIRAFEMIIQAYNAGIISEQDARACIERLNHEWEK